MRFSTTVPTTTQRNLTVISVTPNTGPAAGGTDVVIYGTKFLPGVIIRFSGVTWTTTYVNDSTLLATSPAGTVGKKTCRARNTDGVFFDLLAAFQYV